MTLACLSMYDWPEVSAETQALWADIRDATRQQLPGCELPDILTPVGEADPFALWQSPSLVFSQTCWGPLSLGLIDELLPLAQPDYSAFLGGRGPFYRSALIARAGQVAGVPERPEAAIDPSILSGQRFALNGRHSLSGYLALKDDLGADPCKVAVACVETGGHRASVRAVADGRADLAAIDCRSWAMAQRFEPCADALVVVGWTSERFGLPYVTHRSTDPALAQTLRSTILAMGCFEAPMALNT